MNRRLARLLMLAEMISPMDRPPWRTEATRAPKSWTPPKKMPPMTIHSAQASQPKPKPAALMGPVMGPAPAMEEKWWPIRMGAFAGT